MNEVLDNLLDKEWLLGKKIVWVDRVGDCWGGREELLRYRFEGVKGFFLNSMGVDHFPVVLARRMGFVVEWLPDYCSDFLGQFAWEQALKLIDKVRGGSSFLLAGKVCLVVGSNGNLGRVVCSIARGFGLIVLEFDVVFSYCNNVLLLEWLRKASLIFLCCPLTDVTRDYFKVEHYGVMENKPFIINPVGRLGLLDLRELFWQINEGVVAGYFCDELYLDGVSEYASAVFTPHVGWKCVESVARRRVLQEMVVKGLLEVVKE